MDLDTTVLNNEEQLAIVSSAWIRGTFDFVGKYKGKDDKYLYLENPLSLEYVETNGVRRLEQLGAFHLPIGTVDVVGQKNILALPYDYIGYFVLVPLKGDDWMHEQYEEFFKEPEAAVAD